MFCEKLIGTWGAKRVIRGDGTEKVRKRPGKIRITFNADGSAIIKLLFFKALVRWTENNGLIRLMNNSGERHMDFMMTDDGFVSTDATAEKTYFARIA